MEKLVEFKIERFEGTRAIMSLTDDPNTLIVWPISKLPLEIKKDDHIKFKIVTDKDIELEKQVLARKLLEEMIN